MEINFSVSNRHTLQVVCQYLVSLCPTAGQLVVHVYCYCVVIGSHLVLWSLLVAQSVMNISVSIWHTLLVVSIYYSLHLPWSKLCPCILVCGATSYATPCTTQQVKLSPTLCYVSTSAPYHLQQYSSYCFTRLQHSQYWYLGDADALVTLTYFTACGYCYALPSPTYYYASLYYVPLSVMHYSLLLVLCTTTMLCYSVLVSWCQQLVLASVVSIIILSSCTHGLHSCTMLVEYKYYCVYVEVVSFYAVVSQLLCGNRISSGVMVPTGSIECDEHQCQYMAHSTSSQLVLPGR